MFRKLSGAIARRTSVAGLPAEEPSAFVCARVSVPAAFLTTHGARNAELLEFL